METARTSPLVMAPTRSVDTELENSAFVADRLFPAMSYNQHVSVTSLQIMEKIMLLLLFRNSVLDSGIQKKDTLHHIPQLPWQLRESNKIDFNRCIV